LLLRNDKILVQPDPTQSNVKTTNKSASGKQKHIKMSQSNKYPKQQLVRDEENSNLYSTGEIKILTPAEY
jgi:hypothetical protein